MICPNCDTIMESMGYGDCICDTCRHVEYGDPEAVQALINRTYGANVKVTTYVVFWLGSGTPLSKEFSDMGRALTFCQELRNHKGGDITHVVMSVDNVDQVGGMGVNAVVDGKLPDGSNYSWTKRRYNERANEPTICALCNGTGMCDDFGNCSCQVST